MPKTVIYDVRPAPGGWLVRMAGDSQTEMFSEKGAAIRRAQQLMRAQPQARARVFDASGAIETEYEHRGGGVATR